jgi:hypothetical protein
MPNGRWLPPAESISTRTILSAGMADQLAILAKMLRQRGFSAF